MQEKLLRVLGYLAANVECGVAGKVTTCAWLFSSLCCRERGEWMAGKVPACAWLFGVHIQKSGGGALYLQQYSL